MISIMIKGQTLTDSKNIGRRFYCHVIQGAFIDKYGDRRYRSLCNCGTEFTLDHSSAPHKFSCGCARTKADLNLAKIIGINQPSFCRLKDKPITPADPLRARRKRKEGYIHIYIPDHPNARKGYVPEHRLIMEGIIGRYLRPEETVHHKNLRRDDNQPGNLELWASRHPKGARIIDLVEYARDILREYGQIAENALNPA